MRPLLSVAPVVRPLPRSLTLWARINLDIPNHAGGLAGQPAVAQRLWKLAETHTPQVRVTHYTQAIMDLRCDPVHPLYGRVQEKAQGDGIPARALV
jgi:hypothetical protein